MATTLRREQKCDTPHAIANNTAIVPRPHGYGCFERIIVSLRERGRRPGADVRGGGGGRMHPCRREAERRRGTEGLTGTESVRSKARAPAANQLV